MKKKKLILMLIKTRTHFKTEVSYFGFFMLICVFVLGCKQEEKLTARRIVEQSIEVHGGLEKWNSAKTLSFDKTTTLFNKDGSVESTTMQQQSFQLQPKLKGEIVSFNKSINGLYYDGERFMKRIKDSIYTITNPLELERMKNSFFAAHFVVCQPFKLLDEGAILKFTGIEEMDGKQVNVVAVSYKNDTETSDEWTYYFDVNTYQLVANRVKHNANISLIKNLKFDNQSGLVFNAHRESYTLKASGDTDYLRAEFFYTNFKVSY